MELSPQLKLSIRLFRYAVYLSVIGLGFLEAWSVMFPVTPWIAVFVVIPLLWQGLSDRGYLGWSHTLESISVPLLLWVLNLPAAALGFAAIVAMCNLSLWGPRMVPGVAAAVVLVSLATLQSLSLTVLAFWLIGFACLVNYRSRRGVLA